jgi:NDP-sugar pyrophosphorylase family protein
LAAKKFGVIEKDASGKVLNIEEKPEKPRTSFIGMGVYYFPKNTLGLIREYLGQKNVQDAPGHYVRWLMGKTQIFSFLFSGLWYDIGDLNALDEANRIFRQKS